MPLEFQVRPWLWVKIFLVSLLFLAANILFYWGLFFQGGSIPTVIVPLLEFHGEAPVVISAITQQEEPAYPKQMLFVGDKIQTAANQFAEVRMGKNTLRLGPDAQLQILDTNFNPQPSYRPAAPAMVFQLNQGQVWIRAFDPVVARSERYEAEFIHSVGVVERNDAFNTLSVYSGATSIELKDSDQKPLTQLTLPLLKQAYFSDDQLTADFAFLKPSKLKKELKVTSVPPESLQEPWVAFHLSEETLDPLTLRPIYGRLNYRLHNLDYSMRRLVTFDPAKKDELSLKKANYILRYWLGGVANDPEGKMLERIEREWLKIQGKIKNQTAFQQWSMEVFFQLSWGELNSAQWALKELLFDSLLASQGPAALQDLIYQIQIAFNDQQLGRIQRFTEKWLEYWREQKIDQNLDEFMVQFEMLQQLGLYYPENISQIWLSFLDEASEWLLEHLGEDEEFELALTESRLAQVTALIQVYRYDFAKDYLRSSYQKLPIATGQQLSPSEEVFFELGKLLAQRIEYAELTFGGAALPIEEEEFTRFVLQSRQSDLLSSDLAAFLEVEEIEPHAPPSFLPTVEVLVENLQAEGLILNETNVELSEEDPLAYQLTRARFKDMDEVERHFDALYFPLNRSFGQMVVEGQAITGIFKLADLSRALSLPSLLATPQETEDTSTSVSELFGASGQSGDQKQRMAEELARQLAFNQLNQAGFSLPAPRLIQVVDPIDLERVNVLGASLSGSDFQGVTLNFEFNTSEKILYQVQDAATQELYFEKVSLNEVIDQLAHLIQVKKSQDQGLSRLHEALADQPVTVGEESLSFLSETILQATQITLEDLNVTFNGIFDAEKGVFTSLTHPLYAATQTPIDQYIPALLQAYVDDFLKRNDLPLGGNWNIRQPFNRLKVSNYMVNDNAFAFTLNLEKEVFENIQLKGSDAVLDEVTVDQFKQLSGVQVRGFE